ncbi:MAG TPA: acyltransferase family protein [Solirubrobacterales bacterium]|nr:acyltransferase family protein [Solirubrobacterales bacterium]
MPEPIKSNQRYMPGLDGLRAIAVLGVIVYHLGFEWMPGGLLGVGVFFTLSGYLITDILLGQVERGGIRLKSFWLARARRLLPALFLMLIVVLAWVTVFGPQQSPDFRWAAASAAAYFNNWWLIFHDVSYFAQFEAPEPLNHLWSLSIEEQFYIVWPFLLMIAVKLIPEVRQPGWMRPRLGVAIMALAFASAILMVIIYRPGIDPSRVYYGTDTRVQELMIGAALATIWPSRHLRGRVTSGARRTIDAAGVLGLLVIGLMFWQSTEFSPFLYRGGFLVLSFATVLAVAAMAHPATRLGPIVGCRPMRWIGQRSYGIYLWHFPIIVLTNPEGVEGADLPRAILQTAATFAIAALSWRYVEDPIRHGALGRLWRRWRAGEWRGRRISRPAWAGIALAAATVAAAFAGLAGVNAGPSQAEAPGNISVATTLTDSAVEASEIKDRTVCDSVIHIGDSTSEGLVSSDYLPRSKDQIAAQYGRVGATTQHLEVSGARSIYERFEGLPNAEDIGLAWKQKGFDGCWVLALGTNEAANVAAGSSIDYDQRIETMMKVADGDPVLWVNVRSLVTDGGPYDGSNMQAWDKALLAACIRYPNMRIYDWSSEVKEEWFVEDGIHFTTPGYRQRSRRIADALLNAFPAGAPVDNPENDDCRVGSETGEGPAAAEAVTTTG